MNKLHLSLYFSLIVAIVATSGSLFFSEVIGYPPCVLCWYQRICMYPLALLLLLGIWNDDAKISRYTLPINIIGLCFALYHNLIYYGIIPENLSPCREGVSCADVHIEWLGFITIPMLSLTAFILILVSTLIGNKKS